MKNLLRAAAVAVASTALVAGTATMASAAPGDSATISLQPITLTHYKGGTSTTVPATVATSRPLNLRATVNINSVPVASNVPIYSTGFYYQQGWGAGVLTLTNLTDSSGQAVAGGSNPVQVRYGLDTRSGIDIKKRGKKLTFKVKARYIDNRGVRVGVRKATVQVKKNGKWKTLKKVNLKKNGTKTFKRTDKKKRNYRLVIKTTSLYTGDQTGGSRKI